jgi:hypothetical protein
MVHGQREICWWGVFSCSRKGTPSPLWPTVAPVYSCIARIESAEHKVQEVREVPEMFWNHLSLRFHSAGCLRLEALCLNLTAALPQWANAVPGRSAYWKLFFLKALEKRGGQ